MPRWLRRRSETAQLSQGRGCCLGCMYATSCSSCRDSHKQTNSSKRLLLTSPRCSSGPSDAQTADVLTSTTGFMRVYESLLGVFRVKGLGFSWQRAASVGVSGERFFVSWERRSYWSRGVHTLQGLVLQRMQRQTA